MSCINLRFKKLFSARKVWKSFTSKLQSKIHKLNTPKSAIRKPRRSPLFSFTPPPKTRQGPTNPSHALALQRRRRRRHQKRKPPPIYVDELFRGPVAKLLEEERPKNKVLGKEEVEAAGSAALKTNELVVVANGPATEEMVAATASPSQGIDERAEEFIARFKAEMEMQERLVRGL